MRGKPYSAFIPCTATGITPACAGKTNPARAQSPAGWDHPRVCGENHSEFMYLENNTGSPPRVRGKRRRNPAAFRVPGITPACAGKTMVNLLSGGAPRITPACAGKTCICRLVYCTDVDHPRVCGENPLIIESDYRLQGSPPRVRGKLLTTFYGQSIGGITPACAGKTSSRPSPRKAYRDHPRVCGENER